MRTMVRLHPSLIDPGTAGFIPGINVDIGSPKRSCFKLPTTSRLQFVGLTTRTSTSLMAPRLPSPVFPKIASAVDELFEDATLPLSNEEVTARHSGLWFGDGNVILQTDDLQFRVYKGVLAKNSVVFRDMFATASSSECPIVDGCPVVLLYDWPEDLEHVLLALFDWR